MEMRSGCPPIEEIGAILERGASDEGRLHIETCPRCRARALTYRELVEDRSVPAGARPREAAARLRAAFASETGATTTGAADTTGTAVSTERPRPPVARPRPARPRWFAGLRPAWALVAAAVVVTGVVLIDWRGGPEEGLLRGTPEDGAGGRASAGGALDTEIVLLSAEPAAGGGLRLTWRRASGAAADRIVYAVALFGPDLAEIARLDAGRDTVLVAGPDALAAIGGSGTLGGWQVDALQDGHRTARSRLGTLRVP